MSKRTSNASMTGEAGLASDDAARTQARRLKALQIIIPTPEEDAAITAAALMDRDNPPLAAGEMVQFKPARRPRGRPAKEVIKVPTTIRLDGDVVDAFKVTGNGWQTRLNAVLRDYIAAHNMLVRRYHATIHKHDRETEQLGEFLVMAADAREARAKVKHHLQQTGREDAAGGRVVTVDVGNARMAGLDVIY